MKYINLIIFLLLAYLSVAFPAVAPPKPPSTLQPVVMGVANIVCPSGTDLQSKAECEAFNGPGAGTWHGDLSSSAAHVAVHPRGCWVWGNVNRHWIQPDGVLQTEANSKPICYNGIPALEPVVMSSANTVCAVGTDLQTKEECEAFNGPGAGTWKGDLSGSPPHVAAHPRGCWVWSDANRHWIEPDGVLQTEALSKPICYNGIPGHRGSWVRPAHCQSSRGDCVLSHDGDPSTYSWMTSSYKCGPADISWSLSAATSISGIEISTTSDLGNGGSNTCLKVNVFVDGNKVQNVQRVTIDNAVQSFDQSASWLLENFHPRDSVSTISWSPVQGSQVKLQFANCDERCYTHWPISNVRFLKAPKTLGNLNMKLAPTMQKIVFDASGQLRVNAEMRNRLKGECQNINDYKVIDSVPMQQDANWQCGSNYFSEGGKSMTPTRAIKEDIKSMFSVTDADLDINFFPQGIIQGDTGVDKRSSWCGFPSPQATGFQAPVKYWNQCVMANGGYFNTLQCTGSNNQVHAVIGIAAMNPNVCYPTHAHLNEEAYWQFGGTGTWKAWTHGGRQASKALQNVNKHLNFSSHQQASLATYKDFKDNMVDYPQAESFVYYNDPLPNGKDILEVHQHPGGVVHEMSTKDGEHMVMVYWWAQNYDVVAKTKQKYHFAHYATDSCSLGRIQQVQLSTGHVVPDDLAETQCSVTQKVVTGIYCQRRPSSDTKFGRWSAHGGVLVNPLTGGRLFEMECFDSSCVGFPGGQTAHWWITCGYTWKNMDDLDDNDQVIVDVRTETYQMKHNNYRPDGACDSSWAKAVPAFPKQGWETDSVRPDGRWLKKQWAFQLCYKQESWSNVKKSGNDVVTDLHARTSPSVAGYKRIGYWYKPGSGRNSGVYGDNKAFTEWLYLFSKKEHFSSTGGPLVGASPIVRAYHHFQLGGRRKLATSRLLSDTFKLN